MLHCIYFAPQLYPERGPFENKLHSKLHLFTHGTRHGEAVAREGGCYTPIRQVSDSEPLGLRTHRHRGRLPYLQ